MKTLLLILSQGGLLGALMGALAIAIDFQPMFGSKFTYDYVIASALVSVASSGVWLCFNEQEKNERSK
jgi:hypothetical protein